MIESHILEYLLNSLWQVPVLALATALTITLIQPGQRTRYSLWTLTLLAAIALPFHSKAEPYTPPVHTITPVPVALHVVAALYALTIVLSLTRLYFATRRTRALLARSTPRVLTAAERTILATLTPNPPEIRTTPNSPMLLGLRSPVILIPPHLTELQFTAILAHELAHLRRRDLLSNFILRLAAAPIAYHPATAFLHRRIRHARELLCDQAAARALPTPALYAQTLLDLSRTYIPAAPQTAAGFFNPQPTLEDRVMHLITPPPTRIQRLTRLTTAAALFTASTFAATSFHLIPAAHAQQTVTPPAPTQTFADPAPPAAAPTPQPPAAQAAPKVQIISPATADTPMLIAIPATAAARKAFFHLDINPDGSNPVITDLSPSQLDQATAKLLADAQSALDQTKNLNTQDLQNQVDRLTKTLNSQDFKDQIQLLDKNGKPISLDSPEFKKQIKDLTRQSKALNKDSLKLQTDAMKLQFRQLDTTASRLAMQELTAHLKDLKVQGLAQAPLDPAFSANLQKQLHDQIKLQTDLALNNPQVQAQIAEAKRLTLTARADRAKQLDEAAASIAQARKSITDPTAQKQLDQAQAAIDRARKPILLADPKIDPMNAPANPKP